MFAIKSLWQGLPLLYKLAAVLAVLASLWGAWELMQYNQRQIGRAALEKELRANDQDILKQKEKDDARIRVLPNGDLVDELNGLSD